MNIESARSSFIAESRELIGDMELALLECEQGRASADTINAIFRAAHTIKGNAGLFGLDAIVAFTHIVESALDRIRAGTIALDQEWAAILIECRDHMSELVEAVAAGGSGDDPQLVVWGKELTGRLAALGAFANGAVQADADQADALIKDSAECIRRLLAAADRSELAAEYKRGAEDLLVRLSSAEHARAEGATSEAVESGPCAANPHWHVSLRFERAVLRQGLDPLPFVRYLGKLGRIERILTVEDALPAMHECDAELSYLGYELAFSGCDDRGEIESAFQFVRDECKLTVLPPRASLSGYAALLAGVPEGRDRGLELLCAMGALTAEEGRLALQPVAATDGSSGAPFAPTEAAAPAEHEAARPEMQSIRVDAAKLECLIDLVGELVIAGASTNLLAQRANLADLNESALRLARLVEDVRDQTLQLRMMQIGGTFARFSRIVRDVAREIGKDIRLESHGAETELDKTLIEKIADPLTHLVRNAIDHGIESTAVRVTNGKPAQGVVTLNAFHDSGSVVIEVSDDGGGLNRERILKKALERGLVSSAQQLSDQEVYGLIFEAGFSTAESVTNLSGRGVGMDVVKRNVLQLRGTVEIDSRPGLGTTVRIRLPLTLAIIGGFLVRVGNSAFVIPLDSVEECVDSTQAVALLTDNHRYIDLRGEVLPFVRLREHFGIQGAKTARRESIVVVRCGSARAGFVVDDLLGEHQTVIKPLARVFQHVRSVSGSTILGDGSVALILDANALTAQCREQARSSAPRSASGPVSSAIELEPAT